VQREQRHDEHVDDDVDALLRKVAADGELVTLIEFDDTEDDANHVPCVWRDPTNDFGVNVLAQHRAAQHGA